jgi:hypothetical protein
LFDEKKTVDEKSHDTLLLLWEILSGQPFASLRSTKQPQYPAILAE